MMEKENKNEGVFTTRLSEEALEELNKYMGSFKIGTKNKAITDIIVKHNKIFLIQEKLNKIIEIATEAGAAEDPSKALLKVLREAIKAEKEFVPIPEQKGE